MATLAVYKDKYAAYELSKKNWFKECISLTPTYQTDEDVCEAGLEINVLARQNQDGNNVSRNKSGYFRLLKHVQAF